MPFSGLHGRPRPAADVAHHALVAGEAQEVVGVARVPRRERQAGRVNVPASAAGRGACSVGAGVVRCAHGVTGAIWWLRMCS
ncbi:hypothetical protein FHR33_000906 [Nonomuraea dietziae]|uniref:Uncharacterized protein n=1 Tax=Nonomuraea dietziae TaxID=65515 RepID=A0A7W5Y593_9ACTN|nr:hypothetical protein [Nonomuraea dietziae]